MGSPYDCVTKMLEECGLAYSRENYIALNWPDGVEEWTWEHEEELPPDLRVSSPAPATAPNQAV